MKENFKADKNGNIPVETLKQFVVANLKNDMVSKKVTKKDVEGFLSAFIYNTYGATNVS